MIANTCQIVHNGRQWPSTLSSPHQNVGNDFVRQIDRGGGDYEAGGRGGGGDGGDFLAAKIHFWQKCYERSCPKPLPWDLSWKIHVCWRRRTIVSVRGARILKCREIVQMLCQNGLVIPQNPAECVRIPYWIHNNASSFMTQWSAINTSLRFRRGSPGFDQNFQTTAQALHFHQTLSLLLLSKDALTTTPPQPKIP